MKNSNPVGRELARELLATLINEKNLFAKVAKIEEEKNLAIVTRDGKSLENLTSLEEKILGQLQRNEKKREHVLGELASAVNQQMPDKLSAVLDWPGIDDEVLTSLEKEAEELVDVIFKMQTLSRVNQSMIEDNQRLFKAVISSLNAEPEVGYGIEEGQKKQAAKKPLFVDANC